MATRKNSAVAEKKMLYLNKPTLTNRLLKDYATTKNTSESAVAEQLIWDAVLPSNPDARFMCEHRLYSENGSIGKLMEACFQLSLAGVNRHARYYNMYPLVLFSYNNPSSSYIDPDEPRLHHFIDKFDSICRVMCNGWDLNFKHMFKPSEQRRRMGEYCSDLLRMLQTAPETVNISSFYEIFFEYWDMLNDWNVTHSALADMMVLQKGWVDTPEERVKLLSLLSEVSSEWTTGKASEKTLAMEIKDMQQWIIAGYSMLYESYAIRLDNPPKMPAFYHELLHGSHNSMDSLCYKDIPNELEEKQQLLSQLKTLKMSFEEGEKRIRKEVMGYYTSD